MKRHEPEPSPRQDPPEQAPPPPAREASKNAAARDGSGEPATPAEREGKPRPVVLRITPLRSELDESGGH